VAPRFKIFSDPVHGFISVPRQLIFDLIQTPEVQRLRRIRQLGVGYLVFPGAEHTRFGHALGATALMQDAVNHLAEKGTPISREEALAAQAVALLHDLGHGPFSHTLEHELIADFHHEHMSRRMLVDLNARFGGALDLALTIFDGTYARPFFHQLISSQLDMDRLDYLRRDTFYAGVAEGAIGVQRLIKTMRVDPLEGGPNSRIVIEAKGIYAVENFVLARRLMYWQVYLHKTVLAGDHLLRAIIRRVRWHLREGRGASLAGCASNFLFFLEHRLTGADIHRDDVLEQYRTLDDSDVLFSIKQWLRHDDPVLRDLSRRFIERDFFRVAYLGEAPTPDQLAAWQQVVADGLVQRGLSHRDTAWHDAASYLHLDTSRHAAYAASRDSIAILDRDGTIRELSVSADAHGMDALTAKEERTYLCYPKFVQLDLPLVA